jgi:DNA-binding transcriptional MerR regulator
MKRRPRAPYSSTELARLAGVSFRQIDYWTRSGLIEPSIRDAQGSGTYRRYSEDDLLRCRVIRTLLDCGFSLQHIRRVNLRAEWVDAVREVERALARVAGAARLQAAS